MAPSGERQAVYQSSIKAELHVHIEGCIEPAMALEMAQRNGVQLPFSTLEEAAQAFKEYEHLQQFLDLRDATLQVASLFPWFSQFLASWSKLQLEWHTAGPGDGAGLFRGH